MPQAVLDLATNVLGLPISAGILANGLDELAMDVQYFARGLHKRVRRAITLEELAAAPPRRIAIMVPAWHEADVIERMLEHNRRSLDYDSALFDMFCGTYHNDPATQERVAAVALRDPAIHKIVVPHDGPTSKADCLNWIYHGIVLEEQRRGRRFDILVMHDAEDVIHPLALRLYSLLIPRYEFVQTPVLSLPLATRKLVAATYIDEFVEHHLKDMLVREAIGGLVPSAGVGSAFARDAFDDIARAHGRQPFNVESLTEDYEIGLRFRLAGKRVHFACRSLQRTRTVPRRLFRGERRVVDEEIIATREYFPSGFRASVRQRARWITGIALQAWRQIGWQGPAAVRYCLWRDRKAIATNSLLVGAYLLLALTSGRLALTPADMASIVAPGTAVWWLMALNLVLLVWRVALKMWLVGRVYGAGHALASAPRLVVANLIGLAATMRAIRQYVVHAVTGRPLRWYKTAHEYPSFDVSSELPGDLQRRVP
jgi:adsorption protein B